MNKVDLQGWLTRLDSCSRHGSGPGPGSERAYEHDHLLKKMACEICFDKEFYQLILD